MIKEELAAVMDEGILDPARDVMDWAGENARNQSRAGEEENLKQFRQGARGDFHQSLARGERVDTTPYSPHWRSKVGRAEEEFRNQLSAKAAGPTGAAMRRTNRLGHLDTAPYEAGARSEMPLSIQTYDDLDAAVAANRSGPMDEDDAQRDRDRIRVGAPGTWDDRVSRMRMTPRAATSFIKDADGVVPKQFVQRVHDRLRAGTLDVPVPSTMDEEQEGQDDRASRVAGAIADLLDALK